MRLPRRAQLVAHPRAPRASGYPGDSKNPNGKLRLLYEAAPLAYVAEQAGGAASDGQRRIMDVPPATLHQRTPLFIGSPENVAEAVAFVQGRHDAASLDRRTH